MPTQRYKVLNPRNIARDSPILTYWYPDMGRDKDNDNRPMSIELYEGDTFVPHPQQPIAYLESQGFIAPAEPTGGAENG